MKCGDGPCPFHFASVAECASYAATLPGAGTEITILKRIDKLRPIEVGNLHWCRPHDIDYPQSAYYGKPRKIRR